MSDTVSIADDGPGNACAEDCQGEAVAVVTADRPQHVDRCLQSIVRSCSLHQESPRVLVVDGSRMLARETAAVVAKHRTVEYCGASVRRRLVTRARLAGVPGRVAHHAFGRGTVGCNRNIAVMLTRGSTLLMVDDDVRLEPWVSKHSRPGILLSSCYDLRVWNFFRTRPVALRHAGRSCTSLLAVLRSSIGRRLQEIGPVESLSQAVLDRSQQTADSLSRHTVRIATAGVAGDSALYCPYRLLFMRGIVAADLMADRRAFATALEYREVCRIAPRLIVSPDPTAMGYCMAIHNTGILPPFPPVGTNEDGIFALLMSVIRPDTLYAQVPVGIRHVSDRPPAYATGYPLSASQSRLCDLVGLLVGRTTQAFDTALTLEAIGTNLVASSRGGKSGFCTSIAGPLLRARGHEVEAMTERVVKSGDYPRWWVTTAARYASVFRSRSIDPEFCVPVECRGDGRNFHQRTMRALRSVGELLQWWPAILRTAP